MMDNAKPNRVIQSFYERIHGNYDRVNRWITLGLDGHWRKRLVLESRRLVRPADRVVDLCTGTGKTAQSLRTVCNQGVCQVIGVDFSLDMLSQGRLEAMSDNDADSVAADARLLPFADNSIQAVTISFATRNLDARAGDLEQAMSEVLRILAPGGWLLQLETSQPANRFVRWLFHRFVKLWVPWVVRLMREDRTSYAYLSSSMRSFASPAEQVRRLQAVGFVVTACKPFCMGATCLLVAQKTAARQ